MSGALSNSINFAGKSEFSLTVDGVVSGIPITDTIFTLYDSIYELYPKATLQVLDTGAMYNEYLGFVNGTQIEIAYGSSQENLKRCKYRVIQNSMPEQNNPNTWGGYLNFSLIHDYFGVQTKSSKAFRSNISDIITILVSKYRFSLIDIDTTLNSGLWFQPYLTDAEFIMDRLLPFAYSTSCDNSPFYCFIDSNNGFHMKNFKSLFRQNPKQSLYLKSQGEPSGVAKDSIISISYAQVPVSEQRPFYNRILYSYDMQGKFLKNPKNSLISNYPITDINPLPIKVNTNLVTDLLELYDDDIKSDETINNNLGLEINSTKKAIFMDKLIVTIPFNREFVAGDLVSIHLPAPVDGMTTGESSLRFSGNYLIEATYQKWDGRSSYTMLVCSKQSIKVTSSYRNIALVLNR